MTTTQRNWAGNYEYSTTNFVYPETIEQVQEAVTKAPHLRGLGSRHSFNAIADSSDTIISMQKLNRVIGIDKDNLTVTVEGGIKYGELCDVLHLEGYALHNLASLPHISVVGACMTATHGSGEKNGNLASAVVGLEFVTADGKIVRRNASHEDFPGLVVGLGAYGLVTKITLRIEPTYDVKQDVYLNLPFEQVERHFNDIYASAYSVSLFTHWTDGLVTQAWLKSRVDVEPTKAPENVFGATLAKTPQHPLDEQNAEFCTEQLGIPGPWYERLPHFRMEFTPSNGEEIQSEYFVAREHAVPAIRAIQRIGEQLDPCLYVSEIRRIAADSLWLSPAYQQDVVAFHFTWKREPEKVNAVLPILEAQLAPFNPIPHWGKVFTMSPAEVQSRYERMADFRALVGKYDPDGKFRNDYVNTYVFE